jgi:hypothetical protein
VAVPATRTAAGPSGACSEMPIILDVPLGEYGSGFAGLLNRTCRMHAPEQSAWTLSYLAQASDVNG